MSRWGNVIPQPLQYTLDQIDFLFNWRECEVGQWLVFWTYPFPQLPQIYCYCPLCTHIHSFRPWGFSEVSWKWKLVTDPAFGMFQSRLEWSSKWLKFPTSHTSLEHKSYESFDSWNGPTFSAQFISSALLLADFRLFPAVTIVSDWHNSYCKWSCRNFNEFTSVCCKPVSTGKNSSGTRNFSAWQN